MPDPDPFVVKNMGRISGTMLTENLLRHGADLAFDNDLLYLKVSPQISGTNVDEDGDPNFPSGSAGSAIAVNKENPVYDLDVNGTSNFNNGRVISNATLDNLFINGAGTISSVVGAVNIMPLGPNPIIFHDKVITANLEINDNYITSFSNSNIVFDPSGAGPVNLLATTNVAGDVNVTGNIQIDGNLSKQGNIIVGNDVFIADGIADDTVTINTDFTQDIVPGTNNTYDLGRIDKKWAEVHIPDISNVDNEFISSAVIGTQAQIDGTARTIFAIQSNDDMFVIPDTGITYIEDLKFQDDTISNTLNSPFTFIENGTGYLKFTGINGVVVPVGTTAERPLSPELGDTRYNTDLGILECFDGTVYVVSTGGGATVTEDLMEDFGHIYTIMFG